MENFKPGDIDLRDFRLVPIIAFVVSNKNELRGQQFAVVPHGIYACIVLLQITKNEILGVNQANFSFCESCVLTIR